jgi:hypothetical protein
MRRFNPMPYTTLPDGIRLYYEFSAGIGPKT